MIADNLENYAKSENKADALYEVIDALKKHEEFFIAKTSIPKEIYGTSDQKKLFGCNATRYIQLLLYRSKTLIEGSIFALNSNCALSSLLSVRAHFETTGCLIFLLRRLTSYYEGNIDFERLNNDLKCLALGATTIKLPEVPSPIQVMNLIDFTDDYLRKVLLKGKDVPKKMFRELYEDLCEFCHPNFHGITSGSEIDHEDWSISYKQTGEISKIEFTFFFHLRTSIVLFLHGYEEALNLIKKNETLPTITYK